MLACWIGVDEMRSSRVASGESAFFYHDEMKSLDDRVAREGWKERCASVIGN